MIADQNIGVIDANGELIRATRRWTQTASTSASLGSPSERGGEAWFHICQNKHHRWSLDESRIYQCHLGGVLHPRIRWWEAIEVPRRAIEFLEVAELTLVSLVCADLAMV
jgi:hypothetical protein